MADYIPPEYQSEIAKINRQRAMAQALLQNSFTPKETEVVSGRAVPQGGLQSIAKLLTGGISNYNLGSLDDEASGVQSKIAQYRAGQLRNVLDNPESGLVNPDPQAQALATAILGRRDKKLEGYAKSIENIDPQAAARVYQAGELPTAEYTSPVMPTPTFGIDEGGNRYALTTGIKGDKNITWAPKGVNVNNNIPEARDMAYKAIQPEIKERQIGAQVAKDSIAANSSALEALNAGAKSGSAGEFLQAARKVGTAIGFDLEGKVPTERLAMAMGNHILANAKKLAPVTENDTALIKQIVGSLNTEPQNLTRIFEIMNAASIKNLQQYGDYIDTATASMPDEYGDIVRAAKIGYNVPNLGGNQTQQMRTMQELQRQGGDVTQFRDPSGQPFPAGAKFDIRGTGLPKPAVPSKKIADMTPDEKAAEIKALREQLTGKPAQ